jgi:hypothetical protein
MSVVTQPYDMKDYISVNPSFEWGGNGLLGKYLLINGA